MFVNVVTKFAARFANVEFVAESTSDAINYIGSCAVEWSFTWYDPLGP